ncbi:MAG: hypothetical protein FWH18_12545 [Marinilabiliaceae bacterium]|nr:hypothetical protein [Marinilabiliaceae bacterium]
MVNYKELFRLLKSGLLLYIFYFLCNNPIFAQDDLFNNPVDHALGRTGAVTVDTWSHFSNPSGISDIEQIKVGIGYNRLFEVKDFDAKAAICIFPTKLLNIGAGYVHYGFELFNTQRVNISAARSLAPWIKMGMRFNYIIQHEISSDKHSIFTLDAGLQLKPSEKTGLGFYTVNPFAVKWKLPHWEQYQTSFVAAAFLYEPIKELSFEIGAIKNMKFDPEYSFALNVPVFDKLILRSAILTNPIRIGFGGGFNWKPITLDFAVNHHSVLGFSSSFGLIFSIPNRKK